MIASILISPSLDCRIKEINKIIGELGLKKDHPDLLYFPAESKLGIEIARDIKKHFSTKPYQTNGKVVVLEDTRNFSTEAQNALLKTLEEPPANAILVLGAGSDAKFLPTILSRCRIIRLKNPTSHRTPTSEVGFSENIEELLRSNIEERFEYIEKLKDKDEFLHSLVSFFHQNLHSYSGNKQFLKELLKTEKWSVRNVNIRAILEYLMLVMPQKL